jgi:hypothetical protein
MAGKRRPSTPKQYKDDLLKRTRSASTMSGLTREQIIAELTARTGHKLSLETYKKWETRTPMPHMWIIPFCDVTQTDPYMLLTGVPFRIGRTGELIPRPTEKSAAN